MATKSEKKFRREAREKRIARCFTDKCVFEMILEYFSDFSADYVGKLGDLIYEILLNNGKTFNSKSIREKYEMTIEQLGNYLIMITKTFNCSIIAFPKTEEEYEKFDAREIDDYDFELPIDLNVFEETCQDIITSNPDILKQGE